MQFTYEQKGASAVRLSCKTKIYNLLGSGTKINIYQSFGKTTVWRKRALMIQM